MAGDSAGIVRLAKLFHRRWAVPVIAELYRTNGAKVVTLTNRLGVTRGPLRQTLDDLVAAGWVEPNPGYGHPLRPEYVLTPAGHRLGPACVELLEVLGGLGLADVAGRKWALPVLYALRGGARRFSELGRAIPQITDRALAMTLKQLLECGLVQRRVMDGYPPAPVYQTPLAARALSRPLERLAGG